jgi:type 1 glutamine amidotransferase
MMPSDKTRIAVVTGEHPFRERDFDALFASMDDVAFRREELAEFVVDPARPTYDAVVFYHFHQPRPDPVTARALLELTERGQGIVVLHHALLAFREWEEWGRLVGVADRSFGYTPGQRITVRVADRNHPLVAGLSDWEMTEETYQMDSPEEGVLLTVDHPTSMKGVGWVRTHGNSRVFCFQCGHDNRAYDHPRFRETLHRAILWTARRL